MDWLIGFSYLACILVFGQAAMTIYLAWHDDPWTWQGFTLACGFLGLSVLALAGLAVQ